MILILSLGEGQSVIAKQNSIDSLMALLNKDKEDTNKVKHLCQLIREYELTGDYKEGLNYGNQAIEIARKLNFKRGIANSYLNIGNIYFQRGDYSAALKEYFNALKIYEETGNKQSIATSHNNIGAIYLYQNNYSEALKNHFDALKVREEIGDKKGVAQSYNNIGNIYFAQAENLRSMSGNADSVENKLSEALKNHFAALKIYKELGDKNSIAKAYNNIGVTYFLFGNYSESLKNHLAALKIREEIGDKKGTASSYLNIGILTKDKSDFAWANDYLQKALALGRAIGAKDMVMEAYEALSVFSEKMDDYKNAYHYHQLYSQIKDSLFNEESNKQITEMKTKYETEKKENENKLLTKDNQMKNLEITKQKTHKYVLVGSVIFIIIIALLLFNRHKIKQEKLLSEELLNQEKLRLKSMVIAQEQERKRIAEELHDGIGQMLSAVRLNVAALDDSHDDDYKVQYKNAIELIDDSCSELRNISHNMMPGLLVKSGLIPAINDLSDKLNHSASLKIFVDSDGMEKRLDSNSEIQLYRIIQELLNNIIKYAHASEVHIQFNRSESELTLMIEDDGKGFDTTVLKTSTGNGWNNINSRLGILNAKLEIDSQNGKGTVVFIELPLEMHSIS